MRQFMRKAIIIEIVLGLALAVMGNVMAQQSGCANTADEPRTCVTFRLNPSDLRGDFIVNNNTLPSAFNVNDYGLFGDSARVGTRVAVYVQNIHDDTPENGVLYRYQDVIGLATFPPLGQTMVRRLSPVKTYIRGTLELTCAIKNRMGEDVACMVTIDGATPSDNVTLTPGQKARYILDPGDHALAVIPTGAQASLWSPASITQSVTITASAAPKKVTATFNKVGHLLASLNQPGVVGDWYLGGVQVAAQAANIDQWLAPSQSYRIEVKNLTDLAAGGIYRWRDASANVYLVPAAERTLQLRLQKQYLKGFLNLTCRVTNTSSGETPSCQPVIDGTDVEPIPVGESRQYVLDPGAHQVVVTLASQGDGQPQSVTLRVIITAGMTTRRTVTIRVQPATPTPTAPPV